MRDEGVIKFDCRFTVGPPVAVAGLDALIECRNKLFRENLIGVYDDGIGFGNISTRTNDAGAPTQFVISASQTGHIKEADAAHFSLISKYSVEENWAACTGPLKASSESLTHAMIYDAFPNVNAVIHVHAAKPWALLQGVVPTSGNDVPYGTPAMAYEVERLKQESDLGRHRIFVMAGHEDGILSFGQNLEEAHHTLLSTINKLAVS
jgi:L-ribulose-5-phosphate 4-epimerase